MSNINAGDTACVLVSVALVMLMTPGVGLFYGGMVRRKNVIATIVMSFAVLALISLQWVLFGYSLAFGPDEGGLIGSLEWVGLREVGQAPNPDYAPTIPHLAFMIFQAMFAIITPALLTGAFVERIKFNSFLAFTLLWATLVYDVIAHWVWGVGGILHNLGALDFAGGTVVHVSAGASALAIAWVIGTRKGFGKVPMEPHHIPMTLIGAALLWFGWFGFNAGSAVASNGLTANAFVVTNTAAAAAALTWMALSWMHQRPSVLGIATGAIAGLVAITPASGFVSPLAAIAIGVGAGVICYYALLLRVRMGIDESLDVWAVHGMGGTWGAIATGLFASTLVNPAGADGLLAGNPWQVVVQVVTVAITWLYAFIVTWVLARVIGVAMGLRVEEMEEEVGLDISQHGERAYA